MTDPHDQPAPIPLWRMIEEEQIRQQSGPGTEGLSGFVVVDPGPNPWFFDDESGEWTQRKDSEQ